VNPDSQSTASRDWEELLATLWQRLSTPWRPRLDAQIAMLERLRDRLSECIGCGCLSLRLCQLVNPDDEAAERGPGPRYILDDD
jgi:MerR family transcriptional regulator, redox-sensitive transcriptional activator SoxR